MNLAIDIGNSSIKWACFEGTMMTEHGNDIPTSLLDKAEQVLVCASGNIPESLSAFPRLSNTTALPIHINYKTPETLGADRIADACGAYALYRGKNCLIIDSGTCITVDFLSADGTFEGGAIMPGIWMELHALHTFTARLPLIDTESIHSAPVLGRSTEECMVAGTVGATMLALAGYVTCYKTKRPDLQVILTGGDARLLRPNNQSQWQEVEMLSLIGLNEIMNHNR